VGLSFNLNSFRGEDSLLCPQNLGLKEGLGVPLKRNELLNTILATFSTQKRSRLGCKLAKKSSVVSLVTFENFSDWG